MSLAVLETLIFVGCFTVVPLVIVASVDFARHARWANVLLLAATLSLTAAILTLGMAIGQATG